MQRYRDQSTDEFFAYYTPFPRNRPSQGSQEQAEEFRGQQSAPVNPHSGQRPGKDIQSGPEATSKVLPARQGS